MHKKFEITDTNICKGIAILLMILHHTVGKYYNSFDLSWYATNSDNLLERLVLYLSTSGKVCVSILTILSGYGLLKKYLSLNREVKFLNTRFVVSRLIKFYSIYLPVYAFVLLFNIIFVWNSFVDFKAFYGATSDSNLKLVIKLLIDILGLFDLFGTRSIIDSWYVTAIIVLYILSPIFIYLVKKFNILFVLVCCVPWIISIACGGIKGDAFYYYLSELSLGIYLADSGLLDTCKNKVSVNSRIVSTILLILFLVLRIIFSMCFDILLAISIIIFEIQVLSSLKISKILVYLGINSSNIWLLHKLVLSYLPYAFPVRLVLTFVISLIISIVIQKTKKITRINNSFNFIGQKVMSL